MIVESGLRCNWKIAQNAFSESWHGAGTHSQLLAGHGDLRSKLDVSGNLSRTMADPPQEDREAVLAGAAPRCMPCDGFD